MADKGQGRVAYWDNVRGFLILTVVFGHLIEETMWTSPQLYASFLVIYSFHMPLFVFIAGLMSKDDTSNKQIRKNLATLIAPYLIFETWYGFWEHWTRSTPKLEFSYATPFWPLWFLISLFCWRLMLPYVKNLRWGFLWLILASVGFCASGEAHGYKWSIPRTIYFFPFFYAGHMSRGLNLPEIMAKRWVRVLSGVLFLTICALPAFEIYAVRREWFFGSLNTWDLGYKTMAASLRRLLVYAASFGIGACVLGLTPRRPVPILRGWGERSIAIYLFHSTFHFLALGRNWFGLLPYNATAKGLLVLAVSLILCAVLGSPFWSRLMRWCLAPRVDWLFRPETEQAKTAR